MGIYEENRAYFDEMRNPDAALVSRETAHIEPDRWVVNEVWNLDHPACPNWMRDAYRNCFYPDSRCHIQRIFTGAELTAYLQGQTRALNPTTSTAGASPASR